MADSERLIGLRRLYAIRFTSEDAKKKGMGVLDFSPDYRVECGIREYPVIEGRDIILMEQEARLMRGRDFVYTLAEGNKADKIRKELEEEQTAMETSRASQARGREIIIVHFRNPIEEGEAFNLLSQNNIVHEPLIFGCIRTEHRALELLRDYDVEETEIGEWMAGTPEAEKRRQEYIKLVREMLHPKKNE